MKELTPLMYDTLLVPVGRGLESNTAALEEAANIATENTKIHLLYVWINEGERDDHTPFEGEHPEPIQHALDFLEDEHSLSAETHTDMGDPAEEIVFHAAEHNADAIVMGTTATTGLTRAVLGSVTEKVIRESTRPVIAVTYDNYEAEKEGGEAAATE